MQHITSACCFQPLYSEEEMQSSAATWSRLLLTLYSSDKLNNSASQSVRTMILHRRWSSAILHFFLRLLISQHVLTLSGYVATSSSGVRSASPESLHMQSHVDKITREQSSV